MHRVILADDQSIFRAGVARLLAGQKHIRVVAQCDDVPGTLEAAAANRSYTLLLSEILAVRPDRIFAAAALAGGKILLLAETPGTVSNALLSRIDGCIARKTSAPALLDALKRIGSGERNVGRPPSAAATESTAADDMLATLTRRELQIVGLIIRGAKNREIAAALNTKEQVVKNRLRIIFEKAAVTDRLELALFALHHRAVANVAIREAEALLPVNAAQPNLPG